MTPQFTCRASSYGVDLCRFQKYQEKTEKLIMSKNNQQNKARSKILSQLDGYIKNSGSFFCSNKTSSFEVWIFIIYIILLFIQLPFHEQWEDELQAWLIARDCSIPRIFYMMRYEGHFALWHLLLHPLASIGLPVIAMNIFSTIICIFACWLVVFQSPFPRLSKILILFSAPFIYWYPIVARVYVLIPALMFIIARFYNHRFQKPYVYAILLALLSNTHVFMEGMVFALFCLLFFDFYIIRNTLSSKQKKDCILALVLVISGVFIAFLQVYSTFECTKEASIKTQSLSEIMMRFNSTRQSFGNAYLNISTKTPFLRISFYLSLFACIVCIMRKSFFNAVGMIIGIGWIFLFSVFIYSLGHPQQSYLILVIILFNFWIHLSSNLMLNNNDNIKTADTIVSMALVCLITLFSCRSSLCTIEDIAQPFSTAKQTTEYIKQNLSKQDKIYYFPTSLQTSIICTWLPNYNLFSGENQRRYSYLVLEKSLKRDIQPYHLMKCFEHAQGNQYYAIVLLRKAHDFEIMANELNFSVKLLFESTIPTKHSLLAYTDESYKIYLIKQADKHDNI